MKILNPELPDTALPYLKNVRLDVLAELPGHSFINIEMQVGAQWYFASRSKLDLWLTFLKTVSDQQMEELKMTDSHFAKAVSELELAAMKPEERRRYFSHVEGLRDYRSDLYASALQGKAEGKAEGLAEGKVEGLVIAIAEVCKIRFPSLEPLCSEGLSQLDDAELSLVLKRLLVAQSASDAESILNPLFTSK